MVTEPLEMLSDARWEAADDTGSEQLLLRAASVLEPLEPTEWKRLVRVLGELVENDLKRKNFAAAVVHGERRVSVAERRLGAGSPLLTRAADALATAYRAQKNEGAALALFQRLSLVERVLPLGSAPSTPLTERTPAHRPQRCTTAGERGSVSGANTVVARLAPSFRACYNRVLAQDPNIEGSIRLTASIGASGEVQRVRTLTPASHPEAMVTCPMERLLAARFTPPEGGGATIVVPISFFPR